MPKHVRIQELEKQVKQLKSDNQLLKMCQLFHYGNE
jgi:hypothetical protein